MTKSICAPDLSTGWVSACEHLLSCGGKDINVIVVITKTNQEVARVRGLLDHFLAKREVTNTSKKKVYPVETVASTLFPQALYRSERGENARPFLYEQYKHKFRVARRLPANKRGTYFQRMIAWEGRQGEINQLEFVIQRLKSHLSLSSAYEIGVSDVTDLSTDENDITDEIRIYQPGRDRSTRGFPCLSHISLTLFKNRLHLTALYRNQQFISRAYGNYLGLSRLLSFLCQEVGCEPGELACIASHADMELNEVGKKAVTSLIQQCRLELNSEAR